MSIIALFVVLLFTVSAGSDRAYKAETGFNAPRFEVRATDGNVVSLSELKGRYVLVSFWSSTDAGSRINTNLYDRFLKSMPSEEEQICLLSVNLDRSELLFREIVRRDNLNAKSQFHVYGDQASDMMRSYRQNTKDCQSYLIDPNGVIVAVNPDVDALTRVLS